MAETFVNCEYLQEPKTRKWDIKIKSNKEAPSTEQIQIECLKATGEEALMVQRNKQLELEDWCMNRDARQWVHTSTIMLVPIAKKVLFKSLQRKEK